MNPRYIAYLKTADKPTNWDYMAFISDMKKLYCGDAIEGRISDHDDFTRFIEDYVNGIIFNREVK
jgi:hypothetical protein